MKRWLCSLLASTFLLAASGSLANFHLFQIEQIYSNADGTVQFVVMHEFTGTNGENLWAGQALTMSHGSDTKSLVFPSNLPSSTTAGRRVLIATQGFAALGLVTPDYVIPNGFLHDRRRHPQLRGRRPGDLLVAADRWRELAQSQRHRRS